MPIDPETGNEISVRDIAKYGGAIVRANLPPGTKYWKVADAYHFTGRENKGNHNIFVDMLSADGRKLRGVRANMYVGDRMFTNVLDKPDNEAGTNFPMFRGPRYAVEGADLPSDRAEGFTTDLADEENGNTNGHHSFMVVFQEAIAGGASPPPPPPPTDPTPPPPPPPSQPLTPPAPGAIRGVVVNGGGRSVNLRGPGVDVTGPTGGDGSFGYDNVPPGTYTLTVVGTNVSAELTVQSGQQANLTLTLPVAPPPSPPTAELEALRQQVAQLQQQLAQVGSERDQLRALLAQIRLLIQNAGL